VFCFSRTLTNWTHRTESQFQRMQEFQGRCHESGVLSLGCTCYSPVHYSLLCPKPIWELSIIYTPNWFCCALVVFTVFQYINPNNNQHYGLYLKNTQIKKLITIHSMLTLADQVQNTHTHYHELSSYSFESDRSPPPPSSSGISICTFVPVKQVN
jgi:hypothetical protein